MKVVFSPLSEPIFCARHDSLKALVAPNFRSFRINNMKKHLPWNVPERRFKLGLRFRLERGSAYIQRLMKFVSKFPSTKSCSLRIRLCRGMEVWMPSMTNRSKARFMR